jgi:hypothetical protein
MIVRFLTVCVALVLLELLAFLASRLVSDDVYYRPPTEAEFSGAIAYYEALPAEGRALGWLPPAGALDANGARSSPGAETDAAPCLSLYGDSFTYGAEVDDASVWGALLARRLGCGVANYGVVGFGTDQAMLRHRVRVDDDAPVAVLVHTVENIVRNINQDRTFIYGAGFEPKPRFVLDGSELVLIERPALRNRDHRQYVGAPETLLQHEYFLPGSSPLAKGRIQFPFVWHVPAALTYRRLSRGIVNMAIGGAPWYAELYDRTHASAALALTAGILEAFTVDAEERRQRGVVLLVPTAREILYFLESGRWIQQPLDEMLEARAVEVYDLGPRLVEALELKERDVARVCAFFCTKPRIRGGHYTRAGNALLAEVASELFSEL